MLNFVLLLCKEASMVEHSEYYTYYRERLLGLCPTLSEGLIEELSLGGQVVHFAPREHLIMAGERQVRAFFVVQGLVKAYYPDVERDVTVNFIKEGEFATHYTSLESEMFSSYCFQALEPVVAIATSYDHLRELCRCRDDAEGFLRRLIEVEYARAFAHLQTLLTHSSEARYKLFIREFGSVLSRISVTDLSSYLGISRQSLTMIRKRLLAE